MTKKEQHAEGIKFLEQTLDTADQADACFRDALTQDSVDYRGMHGVISIRSVVPILESLLNSAKEAQCDDCGKLIAECGCEWANKETVHV